MLIYKATNLINGKCYIGQTSKSLEERIKGHLKFSSYYKNMLICRALKKYGIRNFSWEIIQECSSKTEMDEKERYYIERYNSRYPSGYNLTDGGEGTLGKKHTRKSKRKMSKSKTGMYIGEKNPMYGRKHTEETKKKISEAKKGHIRRQTKKERKKRSETITRWRAERKERDGFSYINKVN